MDAAAGYPPHNGGWDVPNDRNGVKLLDAEFRGCVHSYQAFANRMLQIRPSGFRFHPGVCPRWDNEARRPGRGTGFCDSKPSIYQAWLEAAFAQASAAPTPDERIVFLNAWNEWGEGAYLEPDRFFGYAYLAATRRALDRFNARSGAQHISHAPA
jgi:hypothetical protein